MPKPAHNLVHCAKNRSGGHSGPIDHDNRQAQPAGCDQLGLCPNATGIFGHNVGHPMLAHQGLILCRLKGTAGNDDRGLGQRQVPFRFIDQTQKIMVLGRRGKEVEILFTNGQKHPCGFIGQDISRRRERGDMGPVVGHACLPRGPLQRTQRRPHLGTSRHRIPAHLGRKWMCGVNHMGHALPADIVNKPSGATEPTQPLTQRLRCRARGPAGIRKYGLTPGHRMRSKLLRQLRGFRGSAEKKDVLHV